MEVEKSAPVRIKLVKGLPYALRHRDGGARSRATGDPPDMEQHVSLMREVIRDVIRDVIREAIKDMEQHGSLMR
jgi:hypothetical protein